MHAHRPVSHSPAAVSPAISLCPALSANVLVLNRFYQAVRVVNVRRAFSLLCRELAEVVHIEKDAAGVSKWQNIVCCGVKCNVKKGGRTPDQAHMHLIAKPVKPKRSPVINVRLADERYWSRKQFLDNAYWTVELK